MRKPADGHLCWHLIKNTNPARNYACGGFLASLFHKVSCLGKLERYLFAWRFGWLRAELVEHPLLSSPLPPSLSLSLFSCRDIFQLWSLNRKARSIRIDCPWRAAPLSSQCQPVCDREGEKWRKISAALAVSFPHTWVGRLPADRTVERGGLDSRAERKRGTTGDETNLWQRNFCTNSPLQINALVNSG